VQYPCRYLELLAVALLEPALVASVPLPLRATERGWPSPRKDAHLRAVQRPDEVVVDHHAFDRCYRFLGLNKSIATGFNERLAGAVDDDATRGD